MTITITITTTKTKKVAIHSCTASGANGNVYLGFHQYFIYVGSNPVGPRGGKCGNAVAGNRVAGPFRTYELAEQYIQSDANLAVLEVAR